MKSRSGVWCFAVAAVASCGGETPAKAPERQVQETLPPAPTRLKTTSELGEVDAGAVQRVFHSLESSFVDCQKRGLQRVETLSGQVKFFLRIGSEGQAKWAYLEESDVGDRATEKCLLDALLGAKWPRPEGGDAETRHTMELPEQGTRAATDWPSDRVAATLGKYGHAIDQCKRGSNASFRATMYVAPGGSVLAAGVSTSNKDGEERSDCFVKVLTHMKGLPSPGSWPAKVSFGL